MIFYVFNQDNGHPLEQFGKTVALTVECDLQKAASFPRTMIAATNAVIQNIVQMENRRIFRWITPTMANWLHRISAILPAKAGRRSSKPYSIEKVGKCF